MESCLIVQGPTIGDNVIDIKKYWNGFPIIFSTFGSFLESPYVDELAA